MSDSLINRELLRIEIDNRQRLVRCASGRQLALRYFSHALEALPEGVLEEVSNRQDFIRVLPFDQWTANGDNRQAVLIKDKKRRARAVFIDQHNCFNAGRWTFPDCYRNNIIEHTIEVHPDNADVARRIFELYATGNCSLAEVRQMVRTETGKLITKSHIHDGILRNPFYIGFFAWDGEQHRGTHPALISPALFQQVQAILYGHNKPKYQKREFAFGGLLTCAYDDCMVTAEFKKERYTYYRCTGYKGKCDLPRMTEAELGKTFGRCAEEHPHSR